VRTNGEIIKKSIRTGFLLLFLFLGAGSVHGLIAFSTLKAVGRPKLTAFLFL